jgi:hypothetical protein
MMLAVRSLSPALSLTLTFQASSGPDTIIMKLTIEAKVKCKMCGKANCKGHKKEKERKGKDKDAS